MSTEHTVIYYLTEDPNNLKERNEIEYLTSIGRVVLVSHGTKRSSIPRVRQILLPPQSILLTRLIIIWTKFCYLFSKIAHSTQDIRYPERNIYTGTKLTRDIVNKLWIIKLVPWINRFLPTYDWLYFIPFRIALSMTLTKKIRHNCRFFRVVVHDALILRLVKFTILIAQARRSGIKIVGNIKSWDNPFYSQFSTAANGYLVWSESMWRDVQKVHSLGKKVVQIWGARPFYQYHQVVERYKGELLAKGKTSAHFNIGYAAAFTDELMAQHEIALIIKIADYLRIYIPSAVIRVRPYPIIPLQFYAALTDLQNVELVDITGVVDQYQYGTKSYEYRKGSDLERCAYLSTCDCFLSIATSFSFEAAVYGLPIVHLYRSPEHCIDVSEREFFLRLAISDHLYYFTESLATARDYDDLIMMLEQIRTGESEARYLGDKLLRSIGIPGPDETWPSDPNSLRKKLLGIECELGSSI